MEKIIRTPTRVAGGITPEEKTQLDDHARMWISRAMRTAPIEPDKIVPAIKGLYAAAGLKEPRVVIVPSPMVMAFTYGAAAWIWHCRRTKNHAATYDATSAATLAATHAATDSATSAATLDATSDATYDATHAATLAATHAATECARRWSIPYQGGNMRAAYDCYLTAMRDVLGLRLPAHEKYHWWEQAAIHGGFRVLHEEFCIVSDFPEILRVDAENRPHCENGPSHRWRDGWELYYWHGVRVPRHWIMDRASVDPAEVIRAENVEQRAAGAAILGWARMAEKLNRRVIDGNPDSDIGALIELTLPGLDEPGRFLMARCPRNGTICEGVPPVSDIDGLPITTALAAQAWRIGDPQSEYTHPPERT